MPMPSFDHVKVAVLVWPFRPFSQVSNGTLPFFLKIDYNLDFLNDSNQTYI